MNCNPYGLPVFDDEFGLHQTVLNRRRRMTDTLKSNSFVIDSEPGKEYQERQRFWQGCPTLLLTPKGRLFAGWYSGGVGEPHPENYNLLIRSQDFGMTWSSPELIIRSRDPESVAIDIQLWLDPAGRMWLFWVQRFCGESASSADPETWKTYAMICKDPDAERLVWSEPRLIGPGFLRNQPTVLSNGDWILCAYDRSSPYFCYLRSSDQGVTWRKCTAGKKLSDTFEETMMLERRDHSLLMLARDVQPFLVRTVSRDLEGTVWTAGEYTLVQNASSRFHLRRLKSGRVLLIHNDSGKMRTDLRASLSEDDGETWTHSILLDQAESPESAISYPDAVEAPDGRIFIIYDCGRMTFKEIRMAQISEKDILTGKLTDYSSYRGRIISKAPGNPSDEAAYQQKLEQWRLWKRKCADF